MRRLRPVAPILLLALAACPQETAVWLAPGATAGNLTLIFGERRGREMSIHSHVWMNRCQAGSAGESLWEAQIDTSRVTYGHAGPGVLNQTPARPLTPGCYHVTMDGPGTLVFSVDPSGAVTELDSIPR